MTTSLLQRLLADTHAALRHFPAAGRREQTELVVAVRRRWNELVFGPLCRADTLSTAQWRGLDADLAAVSQLAWDLSRAEPDPLRRPALADVGRHAGFARSLGADVRSAAWSPGEHGARIALPDASRQLDVARLAQLYAEELRVVKDWAVLDDTAVDCTVELLDIAGTDGWHAPWYVAAVGSTYRPVNVRGEQLREAARDDVVSDAHPLPTYPRSLLHGALPDGLRTGAIASMAPLVSGPAVTVCVLVYELVVDGRPTVLVLDGNHRLAAARRRHRTGPAPRVLAFRIRERRPVVEVSTVRAGGETWTWAGFTPDVALLRSGRLLPG